VFIYYIIFIRTRGEGRVKCGRRDFIRFETEYYFCFTNSVRSLSAINNLRNYGDYIKETKTRCDGCSYYNNNNNEYLL